MELEVKIRGLMMDPVTNMPVVVLKETQGSGVLPIWVGIYEANAIALEIEKVQTPRPMTHDLLKNVLTGLNVHVEADQNVLEKVVRLRPRRLDFLDFASDGLRFGDADPNWQHAGPVGLLENDDGSIRRRIHHQPPNLDLEFHGASRRLRPSARRPGCWVPSA